MLIYKKKFIYNIKKINLRYDYNLNSLYNNYEFKSFQVSENLRDY
jgi:hypothetical protein